jgi:hypothetical protein
MLGKNVDMRVGIESAADQAIIKSCRFSIEVATAMIGDMGTSALKKIIEKSNEKRNRLNHRNCEKVAPPPAPFVTGKIGLAEKRVWRGAKPSRDEYQRVSNEIGGLAGHCPQRRA